MLAFSGCSFLNEQFDLDLPESDLDPVQMAAITGAAIGGGLGLIAGSTSGHAGEGLIIGSGAGAAIGAGVGYHIEENQSGRASERHAVVENEEIIQTQDREIQDLRERSSDDDSSWSNKSKTRSGGIEEEDIVFEQKPQTLVLASPTSAGTQNARTVARLPGAGNTPSYMRQAPSNRMPSAQAPSYQQEQVAMNSEPAIANSVPRARLGRTAQEIDSFQEEDLVVSNANSEIIPTPPAKGMLPPARTVVEETEDYEEAEEVAEVEEEVEQPEQVASLDETQEDDEDLLAEYEDVNDPLLNEPEPSIEKVTAPSIDVPAPKAITPKPVQTPLPTAKKIDVPAAKKEIAAAVKAADKPKVKATIPAEQDYRSSIESMRTESVKKEKEVEAVEQPEEIVSELASIPREKEKKVPALILSKPAMDSPGCVKSEEEAQRARNATTDADRLFYYRRAARLCPRHVTYHIELAQVYQKIGRLEDAQFEYRQAMDLEPDNEIAKSQLSQLE